MYDYIIEKCNNNGISTSNLELINNAYLLAKKYANNEHFLRVATIITDLNADEKMIISTLLHDAYEEGKIKEEEILDNFGSNILDLLNNLNKLNKLKLNEYTESASIYLRKILVGISEDVRVLIIKLADRLDEMRNGENLPKEEKDKLVNETMNVLIPIAHRLGINSIKSELEDLSLKYSKPDEYKEILEKLDGTREELADSLEEMQNEIISILTNHGISFQIKSRVKSVYSIYNKLSTGRKWSDIYDILAMRLILNSVDDCYLAVGLIHAKYRPIPKRFKDYIAMPKENMYQSLHTGVFGVDGHIFEIQLRTKEMDEIAEHGIASHWSYKEHSTIVTKNLMEQKLELFRNAIELAKNENNDDLFAKSMEEDLLSKQIYVYTPKGDVMELPLGATPLDFAYRIHSDIGDKTVGAIVNDSIVSLDYTLQDGDIIKINTNPSAKPNIDWIKFVKTPQAKNKIKAYFSKRDRENYIEQGKELLEKELRKQKLSFNDTFTDEKQEKLKKELKITNMEDLYLSIGSLRYTPSYIINLISEEKQDINDLMFDRVNRKSNNKDNHKDECLVEGLNDIKINLAKCCHPIPGDEIIGYITKGEGILVHKKNCQNIKDINNRLINVSWNTDGDKLFTTNITIKTNSGNNHILDIVTKASTRNVMISSFKEEEVDGFMSYLISVKINNKDSLELFMNDLKMLEFVEDVKR